MSNMVLRGSVIKNTNSIYAVVIYAGHDTRMYQNKLPRKTRQSYMFFEIHKCTFGMIGIFLILCIFSSLYYIIYFISNKSNFQNLINYRSLSMMRLLVINFGKQLQIYS